MEISSSGEQLNQTSIDDALVVGPEISASSPPEDLLAAQAFIRRLRPHSKSQRQLQDPQLARFTPGALPRSGLRQPFDGKYRPRP